MSEGRSEETDVTMPTWKETLSTPPSWSAAPGAPPPPSWSAAPPPVPEARDRLLVHLVWEVMLAVGAVGLVLLNLAAAPAQHLTNMFGSAAVTGLLAVGLALSLRTATPNLAVGVIAGLTGGLTAYLIREDWNAAGAMAAGIGAAAGVGLLLGLLAALLSVPAWALTIGAVAVLWPAYLGLTGPGVIPAQIGEYPALPAFVGFAAVSMAGGAVWLIPGVRRALSGARREGDPGRWAGLRIGLGALVGLTGSGLIAGVAGVAELMRLQAASPAGSRLLPVAALAAVLIGGVSVFGRRAGVFGTLLGVVIVVSAQYLLILGGAPGWVVELLAGGLVVVGLAVSRLLEGFNQLLTRPRPSH